MELFITLIENTFYISALGLIIYYRVFFYRFAKYKSKPKRNQNLPVSIVVCAKNELENLQENLPFLLNQKYSEFEIIIVNDNSSDGTLEFLLEQEKKNSRIRVLNFDQEKQSIGKKEVLEFGIKNAKFEHLLLTDADCKPQSEYWVALMVNEFSHDKSIVLGIGVYKREKGLVNLLTQLDTAYTAIQYISYALAGKAYMSVGRNVAYRKSLFNQVGGFKDHYDVTSGDDDLFINQAANKNNVAVMIHPSSHTVSNGQKDLKSWLKQKKRHLSAGFHYNTSNLFLLTLYQIFVFLFYHLLVLNICFSEGLKVILTIFMLKNFVQLSIHKRIFAKLELRGILISSTVFDILSLYLSALIGITNLITRKKGTW